MRHRGRVDSNQRDIVRALEKAGCSVVSLSNLGGGVYDLLVGLAGRNYLLECKTEDGEFTEDQVRFGTLWRGHKAIVRSPMEALNAVGLFLTGRSK